MAVLDGPRLGAETSTSQPINPGNDSAFPQPYSDDRSWLDEVGTSGSETRPIHARAAQMEIAHQMVVRAGTQQTPPVPGEAKSVLSEESPSEQDEPELKPDNSERLEGKKGRAAPCDSDLESPDHSGHPGPDLSEVWRLAPNSQQAGNAAGALAPRPAVSTIPLASDVDETGSDQNIPSLARQVSFKLVGSNASSVNVLLTERAGQVQIAVRTPDHELSKTLQTNLGDLVGRLEAKGFKAETCVPGGAHSTTVTRLETSNSEPGRGGSFSSWSGAQQQNRQGNGSGHKQRPRWTAQLEETLSTEETRGQGE